MNETKAGLTGMESIIKDLQKTGEVVNTYFVPYDGTLMAGIELGEMSDEDMEEAIYDRLHDNVENGVFGEVTERGEDEGFKYIRLTINGKPTKAIYRKEDK